jgi:hypothetical protein
VTVLCFFVSLFTPSSSSGHPRRSSSGRWPLLFWSLAASLLVAGRFSSGRSPWTYFFVAFFGAVGIFVLVAAGALFFFFRPVDSFFGHAILFWDGMNFAF